MNIEQQSTATQPAWVERLFLRFLVMYGNLWAQRWAGVPEELVKSEWANALQHHSLDTIKAALDTCQANNPLPPTLPEFNRLCRDCVRRPESIVHDVPRLSVDSTRAKAEIAKLVEGFGSNRGSNDPKDWARIILKEHEAGTYTNYHGLKIAKQALGLIPL